MGTKGNMKRWLTFGVVLIGLLAVALVSYYAEDGVEDNVAPPHVQSALEKTGDDCTAVAQKAAMHLPEALPFQRLEKTARTARVFEMCMHDRGWVENPAWVAFANTAATQQASTQSISVNEAYETLKRKHMSLLNEDGAQPLYWQAMQQAPN